MWDTSIIDAPVPVVTRGGGYGTGGFGTGAYGGGFDVPVPGYHLNMPPDWVTAAVAPYRQFPRTPQRIFAGDVAPWTMTAFLKFENEWHARALLPEYWRDAWDLMPSAPTGPANFGAEGDDRWRGEIRGKLVQLEAAVRELTANLPAQLGHNHPPEPLDEPDLRQLVREAAKNLNTELANPAPSIPAVAAEAKKLDALGSIIEAARQQAVKLGEKVLDTARDRVVESAFAVGGTLLAEHFSQTLHILSEVLNAIWTWISIVTG